MGVQLEDNASVFLRDTKHHADNMEVLVEKPFGSNDYVICPRSTTGDAFKTHLAQNVLRRASDSFELTHSKGAKLDDGSRVAVRKRTAVEVGKAYASKRQKN